MIRLRHKLFVYVMRALDPTILFATILAVIALTQMDASSPPLSQALRDSYHPGDALGIVILAVGWLVIFSALVHYDTDRFTPLRSELVGVVKAMSAAALLLLFVSTAFSYGRLNKIAILAVWVTSVLLAAVSRVLARQFLMAVRRSGYNYRHLVIVGCNEQAAAVAVRVDQLPELGYKIKGFVAECSPHPAYGGEGPGGYPVLGQLGGIRTLLESTTVDEIIICLQLREHFDQILQVIRLAQELGIVARFFPDADGSRILSRVHLERFEGRYVVTLFRQQLLLQLLGKRLLDAATSAGLLVVLSPLLVAVAIAIKATSPGPVLFVQRRVGMNKRTFNLYKFRSMYVDAEQRRQELASLNEMDGPVFKIRNDPRVTPVGRFIRMTSIDELPQLINVLTGQMSLVGPRPPLPEEVDRYEWLYRRRLSIKPGITCFWQISGRNHVSFKQWMELDQRYIDNWSLWLDIKILARTIPAVLSLRGAS